MGTARRRRELSRRLREAQKVLLLKGPFQPRVYPETNMPFDRKMAVNDCGEQDQLMTAEPRHSNDDSAPRKVECPSMTRREGFEYNNAGH